MSPLAHTRSPAWAGAAAWALLTLVAGCANLNDTGLAAMATRVTAYAIVNAQLVQGEMTLYPNHTGTVALQAGELFQQYQAPSSEFAAPSAPPKPSAAQPALNSCAGHFRYTSSTFGTLDLRCNDGTTSELRVALIGETRGYGYGQTATGQSSLTFGMAPAEARAHLTVPPGRQLHDSGSASGLEMR